MILNQGFGCVYESLAKAVIDRNANSAFRSLFFSPPEGIFNPETVVVVVTATKDSFVPFLDVVVFSFS